MDDNDYEIRLMAIMQLLLEIRAQIATFQLRLAQAEQSLAARGMNVQ